jgi:hypothetical protein
LMRFRFTALPNAFGTVNPNREGASKSSCFRQNATK